jgi:hypothetical protein
MKCNKCPINICKDCGKQKHGFSCIDNARLQNNNKLYLKLAYEKSIDIKTCPKCNYYHETTKDNYVTNCLKCNIAYCWKCNKELTDKQKHIDEEHLDLIELSEDEEEYDDDEETDYDIENLSDSDDEEESN